MTWKLSWIWLKMQIKQILSVRRCADEMEEFHVWRSSRLLPIFFLVSFDSYRIEVSMATQFGTVEQLGALFKGLKNVKM
ncbi:hypothetical protein TorRG33x02_222940 [Trema orientale]|uniref:Uncharacterized protein n=1 Tax=Trema orientale TaxID=63057 RepID=A0A2P5E8K2_TREOI|nr:hypothetical protein TorRG33x02_222940 [Trema orientale]